MKSEFSIHLRGDYMYLHGDLQYGDSMEVQSDSMETPSMDMHGDDAWRLQWRLHGDPQRLLETLENPWRSILETRGVSMDLHRSPRRSMEKTQ